MAESGKLRPIPLARPAVGEDEIRAAEQVMRSGWLVTGPRCAEFEQRLASITGRAHAVCVSSGTTALELALWALAERDAERDATTSPREIVVPAAGFPAGVNAALRIGARVVAADVDPATWTMTAEAVEAVISEHTWAIISVDTFGIMADSRPPEALAKERGLYLVDDAACALGALDQYGTGGGNYGQLATFSFHPRKLITTGEGGAVVCDDDQLADCLRQLRNQGQAERGRFIRPGTNARLGEMAAAIGICQLERLHGFLSERRLLVRGYHERLAGLAAAGLLSWQTWPESARPAHQTFALLLADALPSGRDRDGVRAFMKERGIETGVASFALDRLQLCRAMPWFGKARFPVAERLHDHGLALPLYAGMRSADLDRIADALAEAVS